MKQTQAAVVVATIITIAACWASQMRKIDSIVIHHSAGHQGNVEVFRKEHKERGWNDIGYHAVITNGKPNKTKDADGKLQIGRSERVEGAGVWGNNTGRLHVCLVGDFTVDKPTPKQLDTLGELLLMWGKTYNVDSTHVVGHKEIALEGHGTECPGSNENLNLGRIRNWYHACFAEGHKESLSNFLARFKGGFQMSDKVIINTGKGKHILTQGDFLIEDNRLFLKATVLSQIMEVTAPSVFTDEKGDKTYHFFTK